MNTVLVMVLTVVEWHDEITLLLLKKRAKAQSLCPCPGYKPPLREQ